MRLLVPGHGEPQADAVYLDRLIATIADIRAQVGPLARQGLSLEEVRERVDFSAQTEIFGTTPRLRLGFESYWLNPMVENAWKEARSDGDRPGRWRFDAGQRESPARALTLLPVAHDRERLDAPPVVMGRPRRLSGWDGCECRRSDAGNSPPSS